MDALLIVLLIFLVAGALSIPVIAALALTYQMWTPLLAKRKLWLKKMEEGTGSWILKNGKAERFITSNARMDPDPNACNLAPEGLTGDLNTDGRLRIMRTPTGQRYEPDWVQQLDSLLPGGLRYFGPPWKYSIFEYNFRWSVLRESKPLSTEDGLVEARQLDSGKWVASFAQRLDNVFLRDAVYYFRIGDAETRGADSDAKDKSVGMAVDVDALATIRIVDPYKTFFLVHDWLESVLDLLRPSIRSWIASKPYQEVVGKPEVAEREHDEFLKHYPSPDKGKCILAYLEDTYGVRIKRIAFDAVIPPDEYAEATTRRAQAVQDAVRIQILADAEAAKTGILAGGQAKAVEILALADAKRIEIVNKAIAAGGENAFGLEALATFKDIGEKGNTVIIGGTSPVNMMINASKNPQAPPPPSPTAQPPRNRGGNQSPKKPGGKP